MKNKTGKPFAFKKLDEGGYWCIYFDPSLKLDGYYYYYECLRGPCDINNAKLIVRLLNKHEAKAESRR